MSYFDLGSGDLSFDIHIGGGLGGVFNFTSTSAEGDINQQTLDSNSEVRATHGTIKNGQNINSE